MRGKACGALFALIAVGVFAIGLAQSRPGPERIALVVGNAAYETPLPNPVNDARAIAKALGQAGFEVIEVLDADRAEMERAIVEFGRRIEMGGTGLFYYSGHGVQIAQHNFMIPIDANIVSESQIVSEGVDLMRVLDQMAEARNKLNIVILDACRNNPFSEQFEVVAYGLAETLAPPQTYIAYAAAPGQVASDGFGTNSIFTGELIKTINQPGLEIEDVFKRVRAGVLRVTGGEQVPWSSSSITGNFAFVEAEDDGSGGVNRDTIGGLYDELELWSSIERGDDPDGLRAYLDRYPAGSFAQLAQVRLANLEEGDDHGTVSRSLTDGIEIMDEEWVSAKNAAVRVQPTIDSQKLTRLPVGTAVEVTGRVSVEGETWLRVALADGASGFVLGALLSEKSEWLATNETVVARLETGDEETGGGEEAESGALTAERIFGTWCSDAVDIMLAADSMTFLLPSGDELLFAVDRYEIVEGNVWVRWEDHKRRRLVTEFGEIDEDRRKMVQIRGREEPDGSWNTYNRAYTRC